MKEWKIRQKVFRRLYADRIINWFEGNDCPYVETDDETLAQEVVRHLTEDIKVLVYPARSYMIAIVYAKMLAEHFGENVLHALDDVDLLGGLDPWFTPYSKRQEVYDFVLAQMPSLDFMPWQVREATRYFRLEFLLDVPS